MMPASNLCGDLGGCIQTSGVIDRPWLQKTETHDWLMVILVPQVTEVQETQWVGACDVNVTSWVGLVQGW